MNRSLSLNMFMGRVTSEWTDNNNHRQANAD
nr:MAG TPA: hypothetical protein [Caudoviricetes sp.]